MLIPLAYGLAIVMALSILVIGLRFLVAPRAAAASFGVPAKEEGDAAYLSVKGLRDASYGILGLVLLAVGDRHAVGWLLLVVALVPLGDTIVVLRHGGTKTTAFGIHLVTAALLVITAALLFAI